MNYRLRADKVALVLKKTEEELKRGGRADPVYIKSICSTVISEMEKKKAEFLEKEIEKISALPLPPQELVFLLNNIRYIILSDIGRDPAEWDLSTYSDSFECVDRKILDINVYLDNIRSPFNVGSVFRTAESFCFNRVLLSEYTPSPDQKRAMRSSMGSSEIVEWERCGVEELPSPVFALELGGSSIDNFSFPESGTVIIGSEELGVSPEAVKRAKSEGGIVTIPLFGCKSSVNVGVAFGILAYNWVNSIIDVEK